MMMEMDLRFLTKVLTSKHMLKSQMLLEKTFMVMISFINAIKKYLKSNRAIL